MMTRLKQIFNNLKYAFSDREELKWYLEDVFIYSWLTPLRSFKEQLGRMIYWAIRMRKSYDFDAQTLYRVIYYKLDAVYDTMKNHSHLEWNSTEDSKLMRRLNEARVLAKRLSEWEEHRRLSNMMEKYRPKGENQSFLYWSSKGKPIDPKLYSLMVKKTSSRDHQEYQSNKRRLYHLLETYLDSWWD